MFNPIIVHLQKNGIIDGITYNKVENQIFFSNLGVADGIIELEGNKYKVTEMLGD